MIGILCMYVTVDFVLNKIEAEYNILMTCSVDSPNKFVISFQSSASLACTVVLYLHIGITH